MVIGYSGSLEDISILIGGGVQDLYEKNKKKFGKFHIRS